MHTPHSYPGIFFGTNLCLSDSPYSVCNTERIRQMSESFFELTTEFQRQKWKKIFEYMVSQMHATYIYLYLIPL